MLSVRSLAKTFASRTGPVPALRGVDLEVERGSFTAIVGPSGCGKTTLLRTIAGFERPDSGEVLLGGEPVAGARHRLPEHRGIGIVPQEGALFPHMSVARNIAFGLTSPAATGAGPRRLRSRQRRERVAELLELIGMPGHGDRHPAELSGGQQQRVALARALAREPHLVLLDEPFAALDAALRNDLRDEVRDVLARVGATTVLVTHDQEEALSLADHVAVMRAGRVVRAGRPRDVYLAPGDQETAAFLGDVVVLPGRLVAGLAPGATSLPLDATYAQCALGCVAVSLAPGSAMCAPDHCMVMLRPEQIRLTDTGHAARVMRVVYFGHDALLEVRLGRDGTGAALQLRTLGNLLPEVGDVVGVEVVGETTAYPAPTGQAPVLAS